MPTVHKHGTGWSFRGSEGSGQQRRQRRYGPFPTKAAADAAVAEYLVCKSRGIPYRPEAGHRPDFLVAASEHLVWMARTYAASTTHGRDGTLDRYYAWRHGSRRGKLWLDEAISRELLEDYHDSITGRGCGILYANREVVELQSFWRWCCDQDAYRKWTAAYRPVRLPTGTSQLTPDCPTWADIDALLEKCEGWWYSDLVHVLRATGMRSEQAMHLRWSDVDLELMTIEIRPGLSGSKSKHEKKGRVIPLAPALAAELATWGRREGWLIDRRKRPDGAPVGSIDGRKRVTGHGMMRKFWQASGVRATAYRQPHHCFRKTFTTELLAAGTPEHVVNYLTGRQSGLTGDVYTVWRRLEKLTRQAVDLVPPAGHRNVVSLDSSRASGTME